MRGKFPEAMILTTQVLADQQAIYGKESSRLIGTYDILSKIQIAQKLWDEAEHSTRIELTITEKNFGKENFDTGVTHNVVANALLQHKKFVEAEKEAQSSLKILQATASSDHQYIASTEYLLAAALVGQHRAKEAEPMLQENMARWTRAEAPAWRAARTESVLGIALTQLKKPKEAQQALIHAYQVLSTKDSGADTDTIAIAKKNLDELQRCVAEHRLETCELSE